jgi:hypothetical protein
MRWTQEHLVTVRGFIMVAVAALIVVAYLISRVHGS